MQFYLAARSAGSKQIFVTDNFLFKCNTVISILMQKQKCCEILLIILSYEGHRKSWHHMSIFIVVCKLRTLLWKICTIILDKRIRNYLNSSPCLYFLSYCITWQVGNSRIQYYGSHIGILSSDMWTVEFSANISQWKNMFCNNCIGIYILSLVFINYRE